MSEATRGAPSGSPPPTRRSSPHAGNSRTARQPLRPSRRSRRRRRRPSRARRVPAAAATAAAARRAPPSPIFVLFERRSYKFLPDLFIQMYKAKRKKDFMHMTHSPSLQIPGPLFRKENGLAPLN